METKITLYYNYIHNYTYSFVVQLALINNIHKAGSLNIKILSDTCATLIAALRLKLKCPN